jgi:hypothetical protein
MRSAWHSRRASLIHPAARRLIRESLIDERRIVVGEGRANFTRKQHQTFAGFGATRQLEIEKRGEVDTMVDGGLKLISVRSAFRRLRRQILASYPVSGPAASAARGAAKPPRNQKVSAG